MKTRLKIPLLAVIALILLLTAGFAIAQAVDDPSESDQPRIDHVDADPSTDAIEIGDAYDRAVESGDQEAIDRAADAVRDEWLSRLEPEEREAAENSLSEVDVPAGTVAYLNDAINQGQVEQCEQMLDGGRPDELCELIVLYGEGKIEAGAYTKSEVEAVLREQGETR